METAGSAFRSALPGAQLIVGITPSPQSLSPPITRFATSHCWRTGANACKPTECSLICPPLCLTAFASTTHLNEAGAQLYAKILARSLRQHLR